MEEFKLKYKEEAGDLIRNLEKALLELEKKTDDYDIIEEIFRIMHSLKGGGSMFGFDLISNYTHHLETIYDLIRKKQISVNRKILDITFASVDLISSLLNEEEHTEDTYKELIDTINEISENIKTENANKTKTIKEEQTENTFNIEFIPKEDIFDNGTNPLYLVDELHFLGKCTVEAKLNKVPKFEEIDEYKCYTSWNIKISTKENINTIKDVFIFVENECELNIEQIEKNNIKEKENTDKGNNKNKSKKKAAKKENIISSIRVNADKLDQLMNIASELVITQASLTLFAEEKRIPELVEIAENVENISRQLRDIAFSISLTPLETLLIRFQRLVRDLSKKLNKNIALTTEGMDTELDKNLIQILNEPIMHIIRNSIDHGIESKEERKKAGKPEQGEIKIVSFYSGANVNIEISDDGRGIEAQKIKEKAIKIGFIKPDTNISDKEALNLIFLPGLSTAQKITGISGRGVGMDVVKKLISEVRGDVDISSEVGKGTKISISLPLTLSIIDGLLVKINNTNFVIPLVVVNKIYPVKTKDIENKFNCTVVLSGQQIPFHDLTKEFNKNRKELESREIVVVNYEERKVGLVVDTVEGKYQAVLKPIGKMYKKQEMISGASILGDGSVALVLDTNKVIKIFSNEL